ncbi:MULTISPECIES: ABC transporter permease [unclassified Clostridioides]|uniref:ABC transporter permease n=1 Tax=unclassified Clostridioides TaxID=2635829 RepID=UPI001D0BF93A|nr:ABC transporter permease [Clostridioides sp. ES-S-0001-02]MCC0671493.1 ABC transporter permease [Clostridioides sp. ES-S-0145-01]MCC0681006.1 ABC transporter permease [Clostridioides sp. ES-S-0005-03]MCC0764219.1 ABC transporter permease [Clostridioides sp. ES-S-0006-03]UDN47209.1 ABC transporter permease [Clostridioides sp. ES-S-0173-01]
MFNIAQRNIMIFLRNKRGVFSSFLGAIIVIGIYVIFLGENLKEGYPNIKDIDILMNSWAMAGIISVVSVTTTMGSFGVTVLDKELKRNKDFYCSPVKTRELVGGYILSSYLIGVIMSIFTFILAEIYIVSSGGQFLPMLSIIKVIGVILLTVLSSSAMIFFIVNLLNSIDTFSTASTIIGTLIGFLTGIYIPIGSLPQAVQTLIKLFPISHGTVLLRQIITESPSKVTFVDSTNALTEFNEHMGVTFGGIGSLSENSIHIMFLVISAIVFYFVTILMVSRKKARN